MWVEKEMAYLVRFKQLLNKSSYSKLIKNAGVYVSGNVIQNISAFLLTPLWANFLTPEDYGITGTLNVYGQVLLVILSMGLGSAIIRFYYDYANDITKLRKYLSSNLLFLIIVPGVIIGLFSFKGAEFWAKFSSGHIPFFPYVLLEVWVIYFMIVVQAWGGFLRARQKAGQFVFVQYGVFGLNVICGLIFVVGFRWGAVGVILQKMIPYVLMFIVILGWFFQDWFTKSFSLNAVWDSLAYGYPLIIHSLSLWGLTASSRVILEHNVSLTQLGLYNFGYTIGMAMNALTGGINQAWMPYYFNLMKTREHPEPFIVKVVSFWFVLVGGACLVGILFVGEIMQIFLPDRYSGALLYIGPILWGGMLHGVYFFASMSLFFYRKTKLIPVMTGLAALLNIGLNLCFVKHYGAMATAWITVVSEVFLLVVFYFIGQRYQAISYPLWRYGVLMSVIVVAVFIVPCLGTFTFISLSVKFGMIVLFSILGYVLLLSPYMHTRLVVWVHNFM